MMKNTPNNYTKNFKRFADYIKQGYGWIDYDNIRPSWEAMFDELIYDGHIELIANHLLEAYSIETTNRPN